MAAPIIRGDIVTDDAPGGLTITITEESTNQWSILISGSSTSDGQTVNFYASDSNDSILDITIEDGNSNGWMLNVSLGAGNQTYEIVDVGGTIGYGAFEPFNLTEVTIGGDLTADIDVHTIGDFFIGRDIDAGILAEGDIGKINAGRHLLGSISTIYDTGQIIYGRIQQITADGNIGSVSDPLEVDFGN